MHVRNRYTVTLSFSRIQLLNMFAFVRFCSLQAIMLSGKCGHTSTLLSNKVSEAYDAISFVKSPCQTARTKFRKFY